MRELLSLIIPCFNEERTLENCVNNCLALKEHGIDVEIIIIDDCSTDRSYQIAQNLALMHDDVFVVRHEKNRGKGAALRTGFLSVRGDYVGIQDADAEYNPLDYLTLIQVLRENRADIVYGSRYLRQDTRRVLYFWHTWMNRSLTFISNMFTNLDISDVHSCYKLFRRETLQAVAPLLQEDRFGFESEVTILIARMKLRVYECAISYEPRTYEEGKKIGWRDGVRALYCILHYAAHTAPLPMQLLVYFCIGLICAVANISSFSILLALGCALSTATIMAFIVAAGLNYLICLAILFRHKARWSAPGELGVYVAVVCIMGLFDYVLTSGFIGLGLSPVTAKSISALSGFIGNFLFRKYVVF